MSRPNPKVSDLQLVPGWLTTESEEELFYVALPLGYSAKDNFRCYSSYSTLEAAQQEYDLRLAGGWPLFGIIVMTRDGGRVVVRNDDPATGLLGPMEDFGSW